MKVIVPIPITETQYQQSPTDGYGWGYATGAVVYNAGTPYVVGNIVYVAALKSDFECIVGTTGNAPVLAGNTWWVRVGASNAWRPFDGVVSVQEEGYSGSSINSNDKLYVSLRGLGPFDTVALLNVNASGVRTFFQTSFGVSTYDQTISMIDDKEIIDAWTYCFADANFHNNVVFENIDGWGTANDSWLLIEIFLTGAWASDHKAKVGEVVVGLALDIGETHAGVSMDLVDYSRKEFDAFGNATLVKRAYSDNASFEVEVLSARRSRVQALIKGLRATPCVWYPTAADANDGIIIYGFPSSFGITYATPERAYASLEIEGLT